jgi:hypothetical protein
MTKSDEIVRELEKFYCHDAEVFNRDDDRFFVYYAPIFQIVSSDGGLLSVTNDVRFGTDYMKALKQRGWVRSEVDRVKAWALADDLGMIILDITRRKADNSVLDEMRRIYMTRRAGYSWQFIMLAEIKPPHLGTGDIPRRHPAVHR